LQARLYREDVLRQVLVFTDAWLAAMSQSKAGASQSEFIIDEIMTDFEFGCNHEVVIEESLAVNAFIAVLEDKVANGRLTRYYRSYNAESGDIVDAEIQDWDEAVERAIAGAVNIEPVYCIHHE